MNKEHDLKIFDEDLQSKTISFLRFPLIVGVVLIHSYFSEIVIGGTKQINLSDYPIVASVSYLISQIVSRISVPLFFFISGFLFFYKTSSFTKRIYLQKLERRTHSILIPYVFWNLVMILITFLSNIVFPDLMSGKNKMVCDYTLSDWLLAFWDKPMANQLPTESMPINFPLWFIRDLMVVVIFSPFVYFCLKKLRQYIVILLGILWMFNYWFDVVGVNSTAFFFFTAGAYFSVFKKNFVEIMRPWLLLSTLLYILIALTELCFPERDWREYVHNTGILVGIVSAITITAHFIKKGTWRVNSLLADSSFFIYAYHAILLRFIIKFMFKLFYPYYSESTLLILYVVCPATTVLIGLFAYYLLRKYVPGFTSVITGGR